MLPEATEGETAKDSGNGFIITFYYKTVMTFECEGEGNLMLQMVSLGDSSVFSPQTALSSQLL